MKKLKKIFLHVGSDKTGSTAIQHALNANRVVMQQSGYLYAPELYHPLFAAYFSGNPLQLDYFRVRTADFNYDNVKERSAAYVTELKGLLKSREWQYLVLSYEGFTGLTTDEFCELKNFLLNYTDDIEVIYYLRTALSYAPSAISQRIKFGSPRWKIHPPVTYYRPRLDVLRNVFGQSNINLRLFSKKALIGADVVTDFLAQIGLRNLVLSNKSMVELGANKSLSNEAILVGDEIVRLLGDKGPKGAEFNKVFLPYLEKLKGSKISLSNLEKEVIKRATAADVKYLQSVYGIDISDSKAETNKQSQSSPMCSEFINSLAKMLIEQVIPDAKAHDKEKFNCPTEEVIKRAQGSIQCLTQPDQLYRAGEEIILRVKIQNESKYWWGGQIAPVKLSYHWLSQKKVKLGIPGNRTNLPELGISPDAFLELDMKVILPNKPGDYLLELTVLQEYFSWFEAIGFCSQIIPIRVNN